MALISLGFVFYGDMRWALPRSIGFLGVWLGGVLFAVNILFNLRERAVSGVAVQA